MAKETVTFRIDQDKRKTLDKIAAGVDRDRSYLLNEAVDAYLEAHAWQVEHIKEGIRQANRADFASDREVKEALARWRK